LRDGFGLRRHNQQQRAKRDQPPFCKRLHCRQIVQDMFRAIDSRIVQVTAACYRNRGNVLLKKAGVKNAAKCGLPNTCTSPRAVYARELLVHTKQHECTAFELYVVLF
jgi:hypothetical protein